MTHLFQEAWSSDNYKTLRSIVECMKFLRRQNVLYQFFRINISRPLIEGFICQKKLSSFQQSYKNKLISDNPMFLLCDPILQLLNSEKFQAIECKDRSFSAIVWEVFLDRFLNEMSLVFIPGIPETFIRVILILP